MHLLRPFDAPLTPRCQTMEVFMGSPFTRTHIPLWREVAMLEAFIDAPQSHKQLTVFPVIAPHGPVLPYLLSTEIQDSEVLTVREKGEETTSTPDPGLLSGEWGVGQCRKRSRDHRVARELPLS